MKCPKCGFISFDYLDRCKKCGQDLASHKQKLGIGSSRTVVPPTRNADGQPSAPLPEPEREAPLISVTWERSPKKKGTKKKGLLGALTGRRDEREAPESNAAVEPDAPSVETESTSAFSEVLGAGASSTASDLVGQWLENIGRRGAPADLLPDVAPEADPDARTDPGTGDVDEDDLFRKVAAEIAATAEDLPEDSFDAGPAPPEIVRDGWTAEVLDAPPLAPEPPIEPAGWTGEVFRELTGDEPVAEPEPPAVVEVVEVVEATTGFPAPGIGSGAMLVDASYAAATDKTPVEVDEGPEADDESEPTSGFPAPGIDSDARLVDLSLREPAVQVEPTSGFPAPGIDSDAFLVDLSLAAFAEETPAEVDEEPEAANEIEPEPVEEVGPMSGFPAPDVEAGASLVDAWLTAGDSDAGEGDEGDVADEAVSDEEDDAEATGADEAAGDESHWPGAKILAPDAELPRAVETVDPEPEPFDDELRLAADSLPESRGPVDVAAVPIAASEPESEEDEEVEYVEEVVEKASLTRRGVALIIDMVLVSATIGLFLTIGSLISGTVPEADGMVATAAALVRALLAPTLVLLLVLSGAYFTLFHGGAGQTPGKMIAQIRVVDAEGHRLGYARAFLRYVAWLYSGGMFFLGFVWAAFDFNKQAWHDKLAHSCVVPAGEEAD